MRSRLVGLSLSVLLGLGCSSSGGDETADDDAGTVPGECGDGTLNTGEQCDDGNTTPGDGCDASCNGEPVAMRINELVLMDPHVFLFSAADLTNTVNELVADEVTMDGDEPPDGNLDVSFVLNFQQLNPSAPTTPVALVFPDCTAPMANTSCTANAATPPIELVAKNMNAICLDTVPDTTSDYTPPVAAAGPPCFATDPISIQVPVGDFTIPLEKGQIGATYASGSLTTGVIRGFLSETAAEAVTIPEDIDVVGGQPLTNLLRESDQDMDGGVTGWWFYLNFRAEVVPYTE